MKSYRDLIVWQKSVTMVTLVYQFISKFPKEEKYSLTSQIATGSLFEMQTQLQIAVNLDFIQENGLKDIKNLSVEVEKMLNVLIKKLSN